MRSAQALLDRPPGFPSNSGSDEDAAGRIDARFGERWRVRQGLLHRVNCRVPMFTRNAFARQDPDTGAACTGLRGQRGSEQAQLADARIAVQQFDQLTMWPTAAGQLGIQGSETAGRAFGSRGRERRIIGIPDP